MRLSSQPTTQKESAMSDERPKGSPARFGKYLAGAAVLFALIIGYMAFNSQPAQETPSEQGN